MPWMPPDFGREAKLMCKLTIHMESDWHVGSGTGRPGSVDRLIQRDTDDLPYIPAKTLTGILRDSCELVAYGLDNGTNGNWQKWVEYLFGDQPALANGPVDQQPTPAAISIRSAHLPSALGNILKHRPELRAALTFVKPGVAIDDASGTAKPDCLRFEEIARGGTHLEAAYDLNLAGLNELQQQAAKALLVAGAAMVERLGAKRRRGGGRCRITLGEIKMETSKAIDHLGGEAPALPEAKENDQTKQDSDQPNKEAPTALEGEMDKHRDNWYCLELQLETQSPVIVHSRTQGNLVSTLDYIPGTALLPILAKALGNAIDLRKAINNNQLAIGNATPEVSSQQGRAMPFALFQEKQNDQNIYNRLGEAQQIAAQPNQTDTNDQRPQLKGLRAGYVSNVLEKEFSTQKITKAVATHNSVDDVQQRPNETTGGVYSYEAMPAQTKLRSVIRIHNAILPEPQKAKKILDKLVGKNIEIGRSKKDDYGLVAVTAIEELPSQGNSHENIPANGELRVWLLSDVLIRDDRLRPSTSPKDFGQRLGDQLGVKLTLKTDVLSVLARSKRIDSWQTRWGLPRPSLVGLSAGSCFLFTTDREISGQQLQSLEMTGLGERTVEGYGQLCFNDPLLQEENLQTNKDQTPATGEQEETENLSKQQPTIPTNERIDRKSELFKYAHTIEKAAWRATIQRQIVNLAAQSHKRQEILGIYIGENDRGENVSEPTMSQLGVLRSVVMTLSKTDADRAAMVKNWIDCPVDNQPTDKNKKKWPEPKPLSEVKELLTKEGRLWTLLGIDFVPLTMTTNGQEALKKELWLESVQALVLSCIRAHKRDLEPKKKTGG
jgi:CRISPR-associated protein Csx10